MKKNKVKAWLILGKRNVPDVVWWYKFDAEDDARIIDGIVVPCEITYSIPKRRKKKV